MHPKLILFVYFRETEGVLHIVWLYFDVINRNTNQCIKSRLLVKYI